MRIFTSEMMHNLGGGKKTLLEICTFHWNNNNVLSLLSKALFYYVTTIPAQLYCLFNIIKKLLAILLLKKEIFPYEILHVDIKAGEASPMWKAVQRPHGSSRGEMRVKRLWLNGANCLHVKVTVPRSLRCVSVLIHISHLLRLSKRSRSHKKYVLSFRTHVDPDLGFIGSHHVHEDFSDFLPRDDGTWISDSKLPRGVKESLSGTSDCIRAERPQDPLQPWPGKSGFSRIIQERASYLFNNEL